MSDDQERILDEAAMRRLLRRQSGVVTRQQVLALGGSRGDIRNRLRRREWASVHPGVYVEHTGPPTPDQRRWAAVLAVGPGAALHRESALDAHGFGRDRHLRAADEPIRVVVEAARTPVPPPGVRVERVRDAHRWVMSNRSPPRVKFEFAVLKVAADRDEAGSVALLADACRQELTTPPRLAETLRALTRLPCRGRMLEVLDDVASGVHSLLEQRYLERAERAHGLPAGERQVRESTTDGTVYRDVRYGGQRSLVELDGRFGHSDAEDKWDDLDRDLAAAVAGDLTVRLGWRQVLEPCRVAEAVAQILRARGWDGRPTSCGSDCSLPDRVSSGPDVDPDPTPSGGCPEPYSEVAN